MFALGTKICANKMRLFHFMLYLAVSNSLFLSSSVHGRTLTNLAQINDESSNDVSDESSLLRMKDLANKNLLFHKIDAYLRAHPDEQIDELLSEEEMNPNNDGAERLNGKRSAAAVLSSSGTGSSGSSSSSPNKSHEAFAENTLNYIIRFYKLLKHNQMNPAQRNMIMIKIANLKNDLMNYLKLYPENEAPVFFILNKLDYDLVDSGNTGNDEHKMRTKQPFKWGK